MDNEKNDMLKEAREIFKDPVCERLRSIPIENWTLKDMDEEMEAHGKKLERLKELAETGHFIVGLINELGDADPEKTLEDLVELLPLPERDMARDIVHAKTRWEDLPLQRENRQIWHDRVEEALKKRLDAHKSFSIDQVMFDAGIAPRRKEVELE